MATTKAILAAQSDQTVDALVAQNSISLKDAAATNALTIDWAQPAAPRTVNFTDPGGNDSVVYLNATQTINNKTFGPGTTMPDQPQYAHLAGQAGGQTLQGGTGSSETLDLESTANASKGTVRIKDNLVMFANKNITLSGTGSITIANTGDINGLPNTPPLSTSATSKTYVDSQIAASVASGVTFREVILSVNQLDSTNNGLAQAGAFFLLAVAISGDTFILKDNSNTETWTFAAGSGAFQPAVGATASDSMTNLVSRINTDSVFWSAVLETGLQSINASGQVVIVYKKVPSATVNDRVYGVIAGSNGKIVNYGAASDYRSSTAIDIPASDPVSANFGFGRVTAGLMPSEAHLVRDDDTIYTWDADTTTWLQLSKFILATSGAGGATVGQATYDSNKGLAVSTGIVEVKNDNSTIQFNGSGQLIAGVATPKWLKFNKTFTDLSTAATTNNIEVYSLPAAGVIHAVKVKHSTLFSGGAISDYKVSVGITGNLTKYAPDFDVDTAVSATNFLISDVVGSEDHGSVTSIRLAATSAGANLNAATQGSVDVWILTSVAI